MNYAKINLQKNGTVTPAYKFYAIQDTSPGTYDLPDKNSPSYEEMMSKYSSSLIDPIINSINTQIGLHQIDIIVTGVGLILISAGILGTVFAK